MLEIREVTKRYGRAIALAGVDLDVAAGEIVGLLGPNGAGKTTLVSIVAGLRRPDAGRVRVGALDALADPRAARGLTGLAPQDVGVYPTATVRENLRFFGGLAGLRRRAADRRAAEVAEAMGLTDLLDRRAQVLSGGQKRRLHAAAALLHRPPLLLLDEPTVGADVETRAMLLDVVRDLARDGAAVVYTTHYLHELEALDATVAVLEGGRIVARGGQAELVARHAAGAVELVFDGPAPDLPADQAAGAAVAAVPGGARMRIPTDDPARTAAGLLAALNGHATRLRSIEIVRPGLEAVYLALTGRRTATDEEPSDVPA